jgi:hypothetical protein
MSKQKNIKVNVRAKNVVDGIWYHKGIHQKQLSTRELSILSSERKLRLKTIVAPKHTAKTLEKRRKKRLTVGAK